ncbi:hypothetical protein SAMD00019534_013380 [Acytostelium subglobosum LB1]|uniref:hypothetical protein n=1 Tax=Acytostelium subglobosum LB1 TaxID=1410327 RepID=UPI000644A445|nr:hypothetical protein SAMD00019534_013380 [Acytostelium subglobosum LB1]GAM18163.1 hypothetical protein SAMD00019534_013380 [Acytostelium subglobosum LB1]|eukprot:XP_012758759.1 hypothetical protein SAMD00019534_013380 [Acytostelium subglobosum LB1]
MSVDSIWTVCERSMYSYEMCRIEKPESECLRFAAAVSGCTQRVMEELMIDCSSELNDAVRCMDTNGSTKKCDKERIELTNCFKVKSFDKFQGE